MTEPAWSFDIPWRDPTPVAPLPPACWAILTLDDGSSIGGAVHRTYHTGDRYQFVVTIPHADGPPAMAFVGRYRADMVRSIIHVDREQALHHTFEEPGNLSFVARSRLVAAGMMPALQAVRNRGAA